MPDQQTRDWKAARIERGRPALLDNEKRRDRITKQGLIEDVAEIEAIFGRDQEEEDERLLEREL